MRLSSGRPLSQRLAILLAVAAVGILATSCASAAHAGHRASQGGVVTLNHISTLKTLFNRANGHPRLVLIFSPT
jgi:hypothetical protein